MQQKLVVRKRLGRLWTIKNLGDAGRSFGIRSSGHVLSHELSHALFRSLSENDKRDFILSADWGIEKKNKKAYIFPKTNKVFIQEDSRDSIDEDFANHLEYYLFKPKFLKLKSPEAFQWIKNKFGKKFKVKGL
ncbi:hypothetical protein OAQ84_00795 [Bdellovibrionales bacterium]|nr:hypothetical protein [Bdellovibrionales bacterium]